jgi:hypothetical protein
MPSSAAVPGTSHRIDISTLPQIQPAPGATMGLMQCLMWRVFALISLTLGLIGIVVPGLPTVGFVLLAAWCGGRGWPALELWLLHHPRFGQYIRDWRESHAIPLRAKYLATLTMLLSATVLLTTATTPLLLRAGVTGVLMAVAAWMWSRPSL